MTEKEQQIINAFVGKVAKSGVMIPDTMLDPEKGKGKYVKVLKTSDFLREWEEAVKLLKAEDENN